ncbi:MAG: hypothetical protein M3Y48_09200 [Actinomycetota bacterium]|nr:hypothetical protein [Actinomycetota bacterium]
MKPELVARLQHLDLTADPPSEPPNRFSFHYVGSPIEGSLLEDRAAIDSGVYEFSVRDAVLGVFDLPVFENQEFYWSFSSDCWVDILVAAKIGETLDIVLERPFKDVFYVRKYHFPSGVPDCGYGEYAVHLTIDSLRPEWFRVVSSFEPQSKRTSSRLPFFFGFRVYGRPTTGPGYPIWRELLGDAVRQALHSRWQHALLYMAFALEAFIDKRLAERLRLSNVGEAYIDHILQLGERKRELHALNEFGPRLSKGQVNRTAERLNSDVFKQRNQVAHAKTLDEGTPEQFAQALKTAVAFIWDWDADARHLLVPVLPVNSFESMIDEQLIADCQSETS